MITSAEEQKKYVDFLGSPDFLNTLSQYPLSFIEKNKLFTAHFATIIAQSSNISNGTCNLKYYKYNSDTFFTPIIEFGIITSRNAIIQNSYNNTNNSLANIQNSQGLFRKTRTRDAQEFFVDYMEKMPPLSQAESEVLDITPNDDCNINIRFNKRAAKTENLKNQHIYQDIIIQNPDVQSFLLFHFMQISIKENISNLKKTRINKI